MIYRFHTSDKQEALRMTKAVDLYGAIYEFDNWLRGRIDHEGEDLQHVRDILWEHLNDYGIDFDTEYS